MLQLVVFFTAAASKPDQFGVANFEETLRVEAMRKLDNFESYSKNCRASQVDLQRVLREACMDSDYYLAEAVLNVLFERYPGMKLDTMDSDYYLHHIIKEAGCMLNKDSCLADRLPQALLSGGRGGDIISTIRERLNMTSWRSPPWWKLPVRSTVTSAKKAEVARQADKALVRVLNLLNDNGLNFVLPEISDADKKENGVKNFYWSHQGLAYALNHGLPQTAAFLLKKGVSVKNWADKNGSSSWILRQLDEKIAICEKENPNDHLLPRLKECRKLILGALQEDSSRL